MASPDSIVPDPTNPQSFNRYSYSYNNPINFIDPTGHCAYESLPDGSQRQDRLNDEACWNKLDELEEGWGIDILDDDLWELHHLDQLESVFINFSQLLGGSHIWKGILSQDALKNWQDKFIVRGRLGDWTECTTGCTNSGEVRFSLTNSFVELPNAGALFLARNNIIDFSAARVVFAHEFAHVLYRNLPATVQTDYAATRGFVPPRPPIYGNNWVGANGAPTVFDGPDHHLVHITALMVAGGNTWDLVPREAKFTNGPIPPSDRIFVGNIQTYFEGRSFFDMIYNLRR